MAELQPCGTYGAAKRHQNRKEDMCDPCREAYNDARREIERKRRLAKGQIPRLPSLKPADLLAEVQWLLNAGEGEQRILEATLYTGRPEALRQRLWDLKRPDLAAQIFTPWDIAA